MRRNERVESGYVQAASLVAPHGFSTIAALPVADAKTVRQVHGTAVVPESMAGTQADGIWTVSAGVAVAVSTADCLPVLIEDVPRRRVAAVHAGWRGVLAGMAARAIDTLVADGADPKQLRMAIGPSIRCCCFEVDASLADEFADAFGVEVVAPGERKPHVDLVRAFSIEAQRSGVEIHQIEVLPNCTMCEERFGSYRRQGKGVRHNLAFIRCPWPIP